MILINKTMIVRPMKKNNTFLVQIVKFDWLKWISNLAIVLLFVGLFGVLGFIIYRSVPILEKSGLNFIFNKDWDPKNEQFGIWNFVVSTFWTVLITIVFVVILNLFASVLISKFLPNRLKKIILFFVQFFAGVPTVLFGVFGAFVFVNLFRQMGVENPQNMLMAILILTIMILPTTITLTVNLLDNVPKEYELSAYALGINRVTVAFTIVRKICAKAILIVLFFGFCKAIGEVTAISLIAGNGPNSPPINGSFADFFFASITTLSSLIGLEMAENFSDLHESSLFAVSAVLLVIVLFANVLLTFYLNFRLPNFIAKKTNKLWLQIRPNRILDQSWFFRLERFYLSFLYWLRIGMMIISFSFLVLILGWIFGDVVWKGIAHFDFDNLGATTGDNGLLSVLLSTVLLVVAATLFSLPFAFLIAIFLVYYSRQNPFLRRINKFLTFFIYQFSSAPTIIFGMFGLAVFVSFFDLGFSILAAALTMILIILPVMVQAIRQNFESFPSLQYYSASALGLKKHQIIWKLIVPSTLVGLWIAMILAINRVIAESAPILITMGTSVLLPKRGVFSSGRTLSSHMYLVGMESVATNAEGIVYQTAFLTFIFLFILNIIVYFFQQRQMKRSLM